MTFNTIDISPFLHQDETTLNEKKLEIIEQVNLAFSRDGFLYIRNHGISSELIHAVRSHSKQFFSLPESEKKEVSYRAPVPRGYSGCAKENFACLAGEKKPNDLVEKFRIGPIEMPLHENEDYYNDKDAKLMFYPNKWPSNPLNFKDIVEEYYIKMSHLASVMMTIFEKCLQLPSHFFVDKTDKHTSILSINHYPPIRNVQKDQLRLAKHSDVDVFTIVCQDSAGLEILDLNGQWRAVPFIEDALVINVGDCLMFWTNEKWISTSHRVTLPLVKNDPLSSRISMAYFVGANYDAPIHIMESCQTEGDEKQENSPNMTYIQWRKKRIADAIQKRTQ